MQAMASVLAGLMEAVGAAEKVFELIDRQPEIDHHSGSEKPDKLDGVVEFKNVSFAYPTRPNVQVLKNVSFTVQPGEVVALVGNGTNIVNIHNEYHMIALSLSQVLVVVVRAHVSVCLRGSMNLNQALCWWAADLSPSTITPIYTHESLWSGKSRCSMLVPWLRTFLTIFKEPAKVP